MKAFLEDHLATLVPPPNVEISDLSTAASGAPPTVTLFLYEVGEDGHTRNPTPTTRRVGGSVVQERAPVPLRLRYLVTVWADDLVSTHTILGRVIQLFHDEAIIPPTSLSGSLATEGHALKVRLAPLTLEDRTRVWNSVQQHYRLSVIYEVRVVRVESNKVVTSAAVAARELGFGDQGGAP